MCGIAGSFAYGADAPPVDRDELLRVRERMRARGPDGAGLWISPDQRVGLAHRRLAIIELSEAGAQPMADPETGNQIVFNGEIYNHAALRDELLRSGAIVRSHSDTEVLLKLYARDGVAMLSRLRGMFAFALWDAARRQLFLARDAFGIKPLYIADDGHSLRFASQVKALLEAAVNKRPDPAGHAGFLLWGSVPTPHTLYRGIHALLPGHWQMVTVAGPGKPVLFDNARLALGQVPVAGPDGTEAALQAVAEAVRDSVAAHRVADVPVGVFLSAGLDSTMLAACARQLGSLRTMTLGFDAYAGTPYDEAALAGEVAASLGTEHTLQRISAADFAADRERLLAAMDQPSIDGINTWFVSRMAQQQGLKVVLSGIGGDELFGSYPSFHQLPRLRRSLEGMGRLGGLGRAVRQGLAPLSGLLPSAKYAGLLEYGGTLAGAYLLRRSLYMPWELAGVMDPEMAAQGLEELDTLGRLQASMEGIGSERLAISALEMQWYMKHQLLRDADWAGMAHSLEIRVPFVDTTLLRRFIEIPGLDAKEEKRRIARTVAPHLPASVLERPKTGFAVPIHQWLNPSAATTAGNLRGWGRAVYRAFVPA
ncbi:Asparagine synthetase (glutamine-hydrolyzing) [Rubrivivax sp. A210]|uniref:asparagine synthase (glutamine-hydrolyzing) n=1 Tax=Rubrivivax sp. A210 TaxID=2772301 RepID=UPI001918D9AE|nr:asparagine synthase (glutamine-hydrolyzing) [Rubrivivax sp. A210]CAD5369182.1 Asparagine synthetase (glutamine-hydrolyzing) [Rubrivivax sp. A210]